MKLKLMYFDIAGKAEAIRLALTSAGLPFEDVRFQSRDEFIALKLSGYLRFGQVRPYPGFF
jgi:glutathione S-transferase